MGINTYNIDIETGRGIEITTLYFDDNKNSLILKKWEETNLFLLFERMKNSYKEIVNFLEFNNRSEEGDECIVIGKNNSRDYSYLIGEMNERIEDCSFYQDNLVENSTKDRFEEFILGELAKYESHTNSIIDIHTSLN
ncbi:MAG: hypothetical protein PHQ93_06425 [Sulfurimonas sp.]|uniref:hypothetical protein n=1 Tax=Sulfurimonas sp. TaxID=2022749 RepID=UPI0026264AD7|nr:hypothetical protein [Sulfurimonas sp.]MDD5400801.1 hypothetical protein [Sulfurimonas sp.]